MNSPQYRRVASDDSNGVQSPPRAGGGAASGNLVAGRSLQDRVADKLVAFGWVSAALGVACYTNFFSVLLSSSSSSSTGPVLVNRTLLNLAFMGLGINTVLMMYLTVYLPKVKQLQADPSAWAVYCPRVIPIMTVTGIVTAILLIRGTWPKWGFFAPLILGVEAMGMLFSLHFIPWSL